MLIRFWFDGRGSVSVEFVLIAFLVSLTVIAGGRPIARALLMMCYGPAAAALS